MGGWNLTNLILRFLVFATMLLVGRRVAKGLTSVRGARLIAGTTGRWALGLSCLAIAGIFLMMDTRGSSAGLLDIADRGGRNAILAPYYAAAGRSYPAFVSLVLLPPLLATARSRLPRLVRAGALLMAIGALCAALSLPASLAPDDWDLAQHVLNYAAVLGYVLGLVLFWFSGLIAQAPRNLPATPHRRYCTGRYCPGAACTNTAWTSTARTGQPMRLPEPAGSPAPSGSQRANLKVTSWNGRSDSSAVPGPAVTPGAATRRSKRSTV